MTNSLIKQAKQNKKQKRNIIKKEHIELALAWANDEIGISGIARVLNKKSSGATYVFLALALREYIAKK